MTRKMAALMVVVLGWWCAAAIGNPAIDAYTDLLRESEFVCLDQFAEIQRTPPPYVSRLARTLRQFDPLPKVVISWPHFPGVLNDRALFAEITRVFRSAPVGLKYAPDTLLQRVANLNPEVVAVHWSPYHEDDRKPDSITRWSWSKAETCGPITAKDAAYWVDFLRRCQNAKRILGELPVLFVFDHEIGCGDNPVVGDKLNVMADMAKAVFGGPVVYYNDGQHSPGPGAARHVPRSTSPVPTNTRGDLKSFSMYHGPMMAYTWAVMNMTAEANPEADLMAWVSIGGEYTQWPYSSGPNRRSRDVTAPQQLGAAWWAGYLLCADFPARFPAAFGPVHRVKYVCLWPPPLRVGTHQHLIEFIRGALEIRHLPGE